jgi:hypothetical protein
MDKYIGLLVQGLLGNLPSIMTRLQEARDKGTTHAGVFISINIDPKSAVTQKDAVGPVSEMGFVENMESFAQALSREAKEPVWDADSIDWSHGVLLVGQVVDETDCKVHRSLVNAKPQAEKVPTRITTVHFVYLLKMAMYCMPDWKKSHKGCKCNTSDPALNRALCALSTQFTADCTSEKALTRYVKHVLDASINLQGRRKTSDKYMVQVEANDSSFLAVYRMLIDVGLAKFPMDDEARLIGSRPDGMFNLWMAHHVTRALRQLQSGKWYSPELFVAYKADVIVGYMYTCINPVTRGFYVFHAYAKDQPTCDMLVTYLHQTAAMGVATQIIWAKPAYNTPLLEQLPYSNEDMFRKHGYVFDLVARQPVFCSLFKK